MAQLKTKRSQDQDLENSALPSATGKPNLTGRTLNFDRVQTLKRHTSILDGETQVYFSNFSLLKPKQPEVALHQSTKDGPVCGVAFLRLRIHPMIGVGSDEQSMQWSKMELKGPIKATRYEFEWEGKAYSIHRIDKTDRRAMEIQKTLCTHLKVVEEPSQEIVGLFVSEPGIRGRGKLELKDGLSADLEVLILLVIISWREKRGLGG